MLLLDDLFLFHEVLAERYLGLGKKVVIAAYALIAATWLALFRHTIVQLGSALLFVALAFFALSVTADVALEELLRNLGSWRLFPEDGLKFLGTASWCGYYVPISFRSLVSTASARPHQL